MNKTPTLYVIAGCNGAGKSVFSNAVTPSFITSFDYDIRFLKIFYNLSDSELRDRMAHNMARKELNDEIENAISKEIDFCYETNFNSTPLYWPTIFKNAEFKLELFYFCLNSIDEAKRRVQIRVENGGHFVPEKEIEQRFYQGYDNLDKFHHLFDVVHVLNSSTFCKEPQYIFNIKKGEIDIFVEFPDFLKSLTPTVYSLVQNGNK